MPARFLPLICVVACALSVSASCRITREDAIEPLVSLPPVLPEEPAPEPSDKQGGAEPAHGSEALSLWVLNRDEGDFAAPSAPDEEPASSQPVPKDSPPLVVVALEGANEASACARELTRSAVRELEAKRPMAQVVRGTLVRAAELRWGASVDALTHLSWIDSRGHFASLQSTPLPPSLQLLERAHRRGAIVRGRASEVAGGSPVVASPAKPSSETPSESVQPASSSTDPALASPSQSSSSELPPSLSMGADSAEAEEAPGATSMAACSGQSGASRWTLAVLGRFGTELHAAVARPAPLLDAGVVAHDAQFGVTLTGGEGGVVTALSDCRKLPPRARAHLVYEQLLNGLAVQPYFAESCQVGYAYVTAGKFAVTGIAGWAYATASVVGQAPPAPVPEPPPAVRDAPTPPLSDRSTSSESVVLLDAGAPPSAALRTAPPRKDPSP